MEPSQAGRGPDGEGLVGLELLSGGQDRRSFQELEHIPLCCSMFSEIANDAFKAVYIKRNASRLPPSTTRDRLPKAKTSDVWAKTDQRGKRPLVPRGRPLDLVVAGIPALGELKPSRVEHGLGLLVQLPDGAHSQKGRGQLELLSRRTLPHQTKMRGFARSPKHGVPGINAGHNRQVFDSVAEGGTLRQGAKQEQRMSTVDVPEALGDDDVILENIGDQVVQEAACS